MRLGFGNVWRYAPGYHGWQAHNQSGPPNNDIGQGLRLGDHFPACNLVSVGAKDDGAYLGLKPGARAFALREVPAPYLLVELFNELCLLCQKEAPIYSALFRRIEDDPRLAGRLKIMGMGVGSSKREVARFRKKHGVPFPLFADQKREVFSCLGQPELPVLYLLKRQPSGSFRLLYMHPGHIENPSGLLKKLAAIISQD